LTYGFRFVILSTILVKIYEILIIFCISIQKDGSKNSYEKKEGTMEKLSVKATLIC